MPRLDKIKRNKKEKREENQRNHKYVFVYDLSFLWRVIIENYGERSKKNEHDVAEKSNQS